MVDESNVAERDGMDFVTLSASMNGPAKKVIVDYLEGQRIGFIAVGVGCPGPTA